MGTKLNINDLCEVIEQQHKMPLTDRKLDLPIYVELDVSEAIRLVDASRIISKQGAELLGAKHKSVQIMDVFITSLVKELNERGIRFAGLKNKED